jgi:hypothetical protein
MFARFRQTSRRLQVSLVETRRDGGRVRHTHIASLGSVPLTLSVADRLAFWISLHERLDRLGNRLDAAAKFAILQAVHARVPMVTPEEQHAEQLHRAEADARFWETMNARQDDNIALGESYRANGERILDAARAEKARLAADVAASRERLLRAQAGEIVAAPKPMSGKEMLKALGWTRSDLQHARRLGLIEKLGLTDEYIDGLLKQEQRAAKPASRAFLLRRMKG